MAEPSQSDAAARNAAGPPDTSRLGTLLASPCLHASAVGLATLIFWLRPGISNAPILWDRAYFTVLEQAMLRG